jgi:hypothetical protein
LDSPSLSKTISINITLWYIPESEVEEVIADVKEKLCEAFSEYEEYKPTFVFNTY